MGSQHNSPATGKSPTWIQTYLGAHTLSCQEGEAYTVRYMVKAHVPCLMFMSTRTTGSPGSRVSITKYTREEFCLSDHLIIPLRIVMDLLHLLLTHNENHTAAYHNKWSDAYVPILKNRECGPHPNCSLDKVGCSHMVTIGLGGEATEGTAVVGELPVPASEHMILRGVENISSGIVRHPCGIIFLTTSGWGITTDRGHKVMMGIPGNRLQYTFPMCHTEHLPGLLAILNRWLTEDYRHFGLKIATVLPQAVSSVTTPHLQYKNKKDYWSDQWNRRYYVDGARRAMRRTVYNGDDLSVWPYDKYHTNILMCC